MFETGQPVFWQDQLYLTGYGGLPVQAVFIMYRKTKVKTAGIAVQMRDGRWIPKWVKPENLVKREAR